MGWIRFDGDRCKESDWFMGLTLAQRWTYLSLAHYSAPKPRGRIKKMKLELLARRVESDEETVRTVLDSAMNWRDPENGEANPKIIDHGSEWEIVDFPQFNPVPEDESHAERQRRYKERRRQAQGDQEEAEGDGGDGGDGEVTEKVTGDVPTGTGTGTGTDTGTGTGTGTESSAPQRHDKKPEMDEFVRRWNEEVVKEFPEMRAIRALNPARSAALQHRMFPTNPPFPALTIETLTEKLRASPYQPDRPNRRGDWCDFDWIIGVPLKAGGKERPMNWLKLYEGKYAVRERPADEFSGFGKG